MGLLSEKMPSGVFLPNKKISISWREKKVNSLQSIEELSFLNLPKELTFVTF